MVKLAGRRQALCLLFAVGALMALLIPSPQKKMDAADHRDGTNFPNTFVNGRSDLNDIYVFRSPSNPANTVFIMNFQPFPGATGLSPVSADPSQLYDIRIDTTGDAVEDITFRVTFGPPDAQGVQNVTLRGLPASRFGTSPLATGRTGQNLQIAGGGTFRSSIQDDPFFFDAGSFGRFVLNGPTIAGNTMGPRTFPQPLGVARNFFGPNVNTFSNIIEIPSSRIGPDGSLIGVYIALIRNGVLFDRMGRPSISAVIVPNVPRMPAVGDRRDLFNRSLPRNDVRDFTSDFVSVLRGFYNVPLPPGDPRGPTTNSEARATAVARTLLPDILIFQIGNPAGLGTFLTPPANQPGFVALAQGTASPGQVFGNGRLLRDDVIDTEIRILTNDFITTDNVPDDNGARITDTFPYIGAANLPLNGPGTGTNPTPPPP